METEERNMEKITSDIVIEIQDGKPYACCTENIARGKAIRPMMESLGWVFFGEVSKTIQGESTTVAEYHRGE